MQTSEFSFLSRAEKLTLEAYKLPRNSVASMVLSRLAATTLLSPAAALDLTFHSLMVLPTLAYAIGKSINHRQKDFTLPWQHIQRIRNAVAPLLLGSVFGILHPYAGLAVSEPSDKQAIIGMLSSHVGQFQETTCSPIHSFSLVENVAKNHRYAEGIEIFSEENIKALKYARNLEESLEILQAQEAIHKIMNVTHLVMEQIKIDIENSSFSGLTKAILMRVSGVLIPILTPVDFAIALLAQAVFLATGIARLISGRGPIYTEVTSNPLMHASFLIQNILKSVGNLLGTCVWFVSPTIGFKASLLPANLFFKLQMNILMVRIKWKMRFSKANEKFVVPILFREGRESTLSEPKNSSHMTYLIVEKIERSFNLYWVDRPKILCKRRLDTNETLTQIRSMLDDRFPFMDVEKLMNYPVMSIKPPFTGSITYSTIAEQGNARNCVVSNMFGMLEALDMINGKEEVTNLRYKVVREALMKDYGFYKSNFFPFLSRGGGYSLSYIWSYIESHPLCAI